MLSDRYIYTLMARDMVRGMDEAWLKNLYGIALEPDAVFYLSVEPQELVQRNLAKNAALDYWESGMDLGLSRDMFDSFLKYQTAMQAAFRQLQKNLRLHRRGRQPPRRFHHQGTAQKNPRAAGGKMKWFKRRAFRLAAAAGHCSWRAADRRRLVAAADRAARIVSSSLQIAFVVPASVPPGCADGPVPFPAHLGATLVQISRFRSWPSAMILEIAACCSGVS